MSKTWLFAFLLAVPLVGFGVAEGIQAQFNSQLRTAAKRQFPDATPEQLARLFVGSYCKEAGPEATELCGTQRLLDAMSVVAVAAAAAGILLVLLITAAGAFARGNRDALVWVFRPGLYVTAAVLTLLIAAHAALLIAAIYFGESALIDRVHVGIIFTIGLGAIGGVYAVARSAFAVVKRAETMVIGKEVSREDAPQLWGVVETSATRLGSLMPDRIVLGVDPNFFVTEVDVVTLDNRLSGRRTLYCSMPLARILTTGEFTAIVGHELGHFRGEDTKFSARFYPIYRGAGDALTSLKGAGGDGWGVIALLPAMAVFGYFLEAFAVAESRLGRERELVADQAGASVTSDAVMAAALVKVHAYADAWNDVQHASVEAMQQGKILRNTSLLYAGTIADRATLATIDGVLYTHVSHPTDSHPPLAERLDSLKVSLGSVADAALVVAPHNSAATLISGLETLEEEISVAYQTIVAQHLGISLEAAAEEAGAGTA